VLNPPDESNSGTAGVLSCVAVSLARPYKSYRDTLFHYVS
jgi:hypothetical protein